VIRRAFRALAMLAAVPALVLLMFVLVTTGALKALFDEIGSEE
jgi:hypothetical protein